MVVLVIRGVPRNVKYHILRRHFKSFVKDVFLIEPLSERFSRRGSTLKEVAIDANPIDATKLQIGLNGYKMKYNNEDHVLSCWMDDGTWLNQTECLPSKEALVQESSSVVDQSSQAEPQPNDNIPEASKSNNIDDEIKAIDLKIESVKKDRIVLEKKCNILFKRKKALIEQYIGGLGRFKHNPHEPAVPQDKTNKKVIGFYNPYRVILRDMYRLFHKYTTIYQVNDLVEKISSRIRTRLENIEKDKPGVSPDEILFLYRTAYPRSSDEELLGELTGGIKGPVYPSNDEEDGKETTVIDVDEVNDVDMENNLDYWKEEMKQTKKREKPKELTNLNEIATLVGKKKRNGVLRVPIKVILRNVMKLFPNYKIYGEDRLINALSVKIKSRLSELVKDKPPMAPKHIINLYRSHYPHSTDYELLKELTESCSYLM